MEIKISKMLIGLYYPPGKYHIPYQGTFEDDFPFPQVGYVSSLEGNRFQGLYLA